LVGYGAVYGSHWLYGRWSSDQLATAQRTHRHSLPYLELLALTTAVATWGYGWEGHRILLHCDNMTVVDVIKSQSSSDQGLMALVRTLFLLSARSRFALRVVHIAGTDNTLADLLSRDQISRFRELCPAADPSPTPHSPVLPLD
jgi:hypothetical protein